MRKSLSLLRKLEYKVLSEIKLGGNVLDLGGSKKSNYHKLINGNFKVEVVNIDKNSNPDLIFDLEKVFKKAGFQQVEIKEIRTGLFGAIFQLKFGFYKFDIIREIAKFFHVFWDNLLKKIRSNSFIIEKHTPLGYFIIAKK